MRTPFLILPIVLSACASPALVTREAPNQDVQVLGRGWSVTRIAETPPTYRAIRAPMAAQYSPLGPPSRIKTVQATRAIETATGCKVDRPSMYRDVSDYFYAEVVCKTAPRF